MSSSNPNVIRAGEDCWIEARNIRNVRTGVLMNVTGFGVHAVARALYNGRYTLGKPNYARAMRFRMMTPVVAEWSTTPTGIQGQVTAGTATLTANPNRVEIHVTPTQSGGWRCPLVLVQAELTDPVTGYKGRIIDHVYEINFDASG